MCLATRPQPQQQPNGEVFHKDNHGDEQTIEETFKKCMLFAWQQDHAHSNNQIITHIAKITIGIDRQMNNNPKNVCKYAQQHDHAHSNSQMIAFIVKIATWLDRQLDSHSANEHLLLAWTSIWINIFKNCTVVLQRHWRYFFVCISQSLFF